MVVGRVVSSLFVNGTRLTNIFFALEFGKRGGCIEGDRQSRSGKRGPVHVLFLVPGDGERVRDDDVVGDDESSFRGRVKLRVGMGSLRLAAVDAGGGRCQDQGEQGSSIGPIFGHPTLLSLFQERRGGVSISF